METVRARRTVCQVIRPRVAAPQVTTHQAKLLPKMTWKQNWMKCRHFPVTMKGVIIEPKPLMTLRLMKQVVRIWLENVVRSTTAALVTKDPFDPDEFVERLAWRTIGSSGRDNAEQFDPVLLKSAFERTICELKQRDMMVQAHVEQLESQCREEEKAHIQRVGQMHKQNQAAADRFQELDERINFVATKVVHLGDQLEGVNTPRARAAEAQRLMNHFSEFMAIGPLKSPIFAEQVQLQLAADVIQKLHQIAQELPLEGKFERAKRRIEEKYGEIEKEMIAEFRNAHHVGDKKKMKRYANTLSHFKGYNECIDAFIEESEKGAFMRGDVFEAIPPLVGKTNTLIKEVFVSPELAMSKLVLNLYHGRIQDHVTSVLEQNRDPEKYLQNLYSLHTKTTQLSAHLSSYKMGTDTSFLSRLTRHIFERHTTNYVNLEASFLAEKCASILQRYYDSKNHQKKNLHSGGMSELKRDLQVVIGNKANINIATVENYGGETFLSHEVAINLLQESKMAFKRCKSLSNPNDVANNAAKIFDILVQYLCSEHIEYAIELGLQAIPIADPKTEPQIYFFDVVGQANTIFHLFEKQFSDQLIPLISSSNRYSDCVQKKKEIMESMEGKLDTGLDKTMIAIIGWVKHMLQTEQKKSDFKPESDGKQMQMFSPVCGKVVQFITEEVDTIRFGLDGKNVDAVLSELGIRFHRAIYDHLQQFQYSTMGGMLAICDVNEYRKCVKEFGIPLVMQLFETLHALCNLLVVVPENLKQVCTGERLAGLERPVLQSFIQLRADYKTARIANYFK